MDRKYNYVYKIINQINGYIYIGGPKHKDNYKGLNTGSFFIYNPITLIRKRLQKNQEIPYGWIKGIPKKKI